MTRVALVRHPPADWSLVKAHSLRGLGADLVPLTSAGTAAVPQIVETLRREEPFEVVLSSPMTRALQAAAAIARHLAVEVSVDFDLREWLPDNSQMRIGEEVPRKAQAELRALDGRWPQGQTRAWEPVDQLRARALDAIGRVAEVGAVVIVSHGVLLEALTGHRFAEGEVRSTSFEALRARQ